MFDNTGFTLYILHLTYSPTLCRNTKKGKTGLVFVLLYFALNTDKSTQNPNDKSVKLGDQSGDQRQKRGRLGCRLVEKLLLARRVGGRELLLAKYKEFLHDFFA